MADDRIPILRVLFEQAIALPVAERERFVLEACAGDTALAADLRSMLAADDADSWIQELIDEAAADAFTDFEPFMPPGTIIDDYRLESILGSGGMGDVYEAQQLAPVQRRVAIKLIKPGMQSTEVLKRFESERQTLAVMNHPSISQVYDAGTTASGQPYFVMEYVDGPTITEFCQLQALSLTERIELFLKVCDGVQHAHQKGVIHRDLKPSNVLVTLNDGLAVPKIIDFGVAKATEKELAERTAFTELGQLIGTPEYMSPEQAALTDLDLDTRSDVYSLGAMFYELITGARPFESEALRAAGFDEIRRIIREEDPPLPSTRLSAIGRALDSPETLNRARQLSGDLDWITLKAMEKDRSRRYASAGELISDIRRYQTNEPVVASPPDVGYRIGKFVRRHRVGVILAATAASLFVAGSIGTGLGLIRALEAERAAAKSALTSERTVEFMQEMFTSADPAQARGETITVKEVLDVGVEQIRTELTEQPEVRFRLLEIMADVYLSLGLYGQAQALYLESDEVLTSLRDSDIFADPSLFGEASFRLRRALATLALDLIDPATAEEMLNALLADENSVPQHHPERVLAIQALGHTKYRQGKYTEAIAFYDEAMQHIEPSDPGSPKLTANLMSSKGGAFDELTEFPAAISEVEQAIELLSAELGEQHPDTIVARSNLARILKNAGRMDEAERLYRLVASQQAAVLGPDHVHYGVTLANFGTMIRNAGRYEEAAEMHEKSLAILTGELGSDHAWVRAIQSNTAQVYHDQGRTQEAISLYRELMDKESRLLPPEHPDRAFVFNNLGMIYHSTGDLDEAEVLLSEALEIRIAAFGEQHSLVAAGYINLGRVRRDRGDDDGAIQYFEKSLEINRGLLDANHPDIGRGLKELGFIYLKTGQLERAGRVLGEARLILKTSFPPGHWLTAETESLLGAVRLAEGRLDEAEILLLGVRDSLGAGEDRLSAAAESNLHRLIELYQKKGESEAARGFQIELERLERERQQQAPN